MKIEPMWTLVATIVCLSRRGDKWVAKEKEGGKVILVDNSPGDSLAEGMKVPISIDKELESCSFGRVNPSISIDGRIAWLPLYMAFSSEEVVREKAEEFAAKWEEEAEKTRAEVAAYHAKQAERKLVVERLLDLDTRKSVGRYLGRIQKQSPVPLTAEERETIRSYFSLPPWGVTDKEDHVLTDSYTD